MAADSKPSVPLATGGAKTLNVACPHCSAHVASPVRVSTRKGDALHLDLTMQCKNCKQTWVVQKLSHDALSL